MDVVDRGMNFIDNAGRFLNNYNEMNQRDIYSDKGFHHGSNINFREQLSNLSDEMKKGKWKQPKIIDNVIGVGDALVDRGIWKANQAIGALAPVNEKWAGKLGNLVNKAYGAYQRGRDVLNTGKELWETGKNVWNKGKEIWNTVSGMGKRVMSLFK